MEASESPQAVSRPHALGALRELADVVRSELDDPYDETVLAPVTEAKLRAALVRADSAVARERAVLRAEAYDSTHHNGRGL